MVIWVADNSCRELMFVVDGASKPVQENLPTNKDAVDEL
jgi:hypothetical protein